MRATLAGMICLALAACTGGGGEPGEPDQPAAPALTLTVLSIPLNCQAVPGVPDGCQVGGSGMAARLGKVRVYASVRLGGPRPGGVGGRRLGRAVRRAGGVPAVTSGDPAVFLDTPAATGFRWSGCRDGSEVVHYRINGGGHQAPRTIAGRPFAQVVWDFFTAHPLPG